MEIRGHYEINDGMVMAQHIALDISAHRRKPLYKETNEKADSAAKAKSRERQCCLSI